MSSGSLLNNLLGISSANPAGAKPSASQVRAESGQKFQQTFEQLRPEVAARKPDIRRTRPAESSSDVRPASMATPQRDLQKKDQRAEAQSGTNEKSNLARSDRADTTPNRSNPKSADVQAKKSGEKDPATEKSVSLMNSDGSPMMSDGTEAVPEGMQDQLETQLVLSDEAVKTSTDDDDTEATETPILVDPALVGVQPLVSPLTATGVSGVKGEPLSSGLAATASSVSTVEADVLSAAQALTDALGESVNEEGTDTANADTDLLTATDSGDNPDFMLLNAKTALNKLAEGKMPAADLDKSLAATDTAKPALTAATEAFTRLTEAQSPAARGFVVQTGMPVALGSPQWSQAVGDKVLWLAAQNVSAAEIRLDPPELGPLQVKVSVSPDQQASVTFSSPHPAVREVLDQQLNRLREMFSEQGLNLVNVDVSDKSFTKREQEESAKQQANTELDDEELAPVAVSQAISSRLVDHYA